MSSGISVDSVDRVSHDSDRSTVSFAFGHVTLVNRMLAKFVAPYGVKAAVTDFENVKRHGNRAETTVKALYFDRELECYFSIVPILLV